ncbi:uncharacterized protein [Solanum tuberosum]|uniref:uncharacterized protein n=1 Tax=Solanum tuberosum TaxID=4113 RepID=UPI00073A32B1|nr:PREDICTED: uncharacterized protein LOC107062670 [Solanum tuberosum]
MDLFQGPQKLVKYRRKLGMKNAMVNTTSKIWVYWNTELEREVMRDSYQQLTIKFRHVTCQKEVVISTVYARCTLLERLELWEDLEDIAANVDVPWIVGGDFNVILEETEKLGGLPVTQQETTDFAQCLSSCNLSEITFKGKHNKTFQKLRNLKRALSQWSKETYGNIFEKIDAPKDIFKVKEQQMEVGPTNQNKKELAKPEEVVKSYYQIEEQYGKQKAGMQWFKEGDKNTKFFHSYVKGRRRKLMIWEIQIEDGEVLQNTNSIGEEAVKVFKE